MDVERMLVTLVAQTGAVEEAVARGISSGHFVDPACRNVFDFCLDHARKYAKPPSFSTVKSAKACEGFLFEPTTDSLDYVSDRFVGLVKRRKTIEAVTEIIGYVEQPEADMLNLDEMLLDCAMRVAMSVPGSRSESFRDMSRRIADHRAKKLAGDWHGIEMGIPAFDSLTMGVQPHEFVSVAGWQGTGKSTLGTHACWHAYLQGRTPMIWSLEMEAEAILRKFDVMALNWEQDRAAMISSLALKGYSMTDESMVRWELLADRAKNAANDIRIIDDVGSPTLERLYAEISRSRPDMVVVDYVSLMETPGKDSAMWEGLTRLTKGLKLMARTTKTPIWGLAQTNLQGAQDGAKLENIAYTRSLGQDSDIMLGLRQTPEMKGNKQMTLRMLKNRDGKITETDMLWDPEFARFERWEDRHALEGKFRETV